MHRARHPNIAPNGTWIWSGYENVTVPPSPNMSFNFADTTAAKLWAPAVAKGSLWLHGFFKFDCPSAPTPSPPAPLTHHRRRRRRQFRALRLA